MAYGKSRRFFAGVGAALVAAVLASACTTPVEDVAVAPGRTGAPTDTGTYPNLNIAPKAATAQFTDQEKNAKLAKLTALQQRQNPGGTPAASDAETQRKRLKVAADEQQDRLKVIEGE